MIDPEITPIAGLFVANEIKIVDIITSLVRVLEFLRLDHAPV